MLNQAIDRGKDGHWVLEILSHWKMATTSAVLCVRSHPSGDPAPSAVDVQLTQLLRKASETVDIPFLDHVVIGTMDDDPLT